MAAHEAREQVRVTVGEPRAAVTMRDVRMRGFSRRIAVDDALAILVARTEALAPETIAVGDAVGRVAAADVEAVVAVPHFVRSAMDGYALVAASTEGATEEAPITLPVVGQARPGKPFGGRVEAGQAVAVTTGAPLPEGVDAVLVAERAESADDGRAVRVLASVSAGKHVGGIGEDVAAGALVVPRGRRLRPQDVGLVASVGVASLAVILRPTVRVIVTGDELLPPGSVPSGARIVDSNSLVLGALARRDGAASVVVQYVVDDRAATRAALTSAVEDVVLVSGGSSVGPEDHAPLVLAEIGELAVHGVALRPAGPAGFGFLGPRPVFLLPGNPVSCLCAYEFFAGPTIRALSGLPREWPHARLTCRAGAPIGGDEGRTDYVRVRVEGGVAHPLAAGASILSSTTRADGAVVVPPERAAYAEGEVVSVLLY